MCCDSQSWQKLHKNPADILSKHCGAQQLWPHVKPLFFAMGSDLVFKEGEEYMDDIDDEEKKIIEVNGKWIFNNGYQYLTLDKNYLVDKEGSDVNHARLETVTDHVIPYGI